MKIANIKNNTMGKMNSKVKTDKWTLMKTKVKKNNQENKKETNICEHYNIKCLGTENMEHKG